MSNENVNDKMTEALGEIDRICTVMGWSALSDAHGKISGIASDALALAPRPQKTVSRDVIEATILNSKSSLLFIGEIKDFDSIVDSVYALQLPAPQPVSTGEEILHLVRFLANYQRELCDIRAQAMRLLHLGDTEGARDLLVGKWPIVQGSQNQWDLESIGKQPFDMAKMRPAIKAILDGSASRPPVPSVVGVPSVLELFVQLENVRRNASTNRTSMAYNEKAAEFILAHLLTRQSDMGAVVEFLEQVSTVEPTDGEELWIHTVKARARQELAALRNGGVR